MTSLPTTINWKKKKKENHQVLTIEKKLKKKTP